ncbi:MAG: hypothetical protein ABI673_05460 [Novosphingobium sp.]
MTDANASVNETDQSREELRDKLAQSRQSLTERPVPETDPPEGFVALAMDYPFAAIAGGLAIGLLAGSFLPRGTGRRLAKVATSAALTAGSIGRDYGMQALETVGEASRDGRQKLGELGHAAAAQGKRALHTTDEQARKGRDLGLRLVGEAMKFASTLRL